MLGASRKWDQVGPQPIEVKEIEALMNMQGERNPDERMKALRLIKKLDRVELEYLHAKRKK